MKKNNLYSTCETIKQLRSIEFSFLYGIIIDEENNDEEQFHIESSENDKKFVVMIMT